MMIRKLGRCISLLVGLLAVGVLRADSGDSWTFTLNEGESTKGILASGNWQLKAMLDAANSDQLRLGHGGWEAAEAYVAGSGVLDLTTPIYQGDKRLTLFRIQRTAFQVFSAAAVKRVILPDTISSVDTYAFSGCSTIDKVILRSTNVVSLTERAFFNMANMKRLDLALPRMASFANQAISGGSKQVLCLDATGYGDIPEAWLGGVSAGTLVLKTVQGQKLATKAFLYRDWKRIVLTGDKPDFSAAVEPLIDNRIFGDKDMYQGTVQFCVPFDNYTYADWRAAASERPLSAAELDAYHARFPGDPDPIGWLSGSLCGTVYDQILREVNPLVWEGSLVIGATGEYQHLFAGARTIYGLDDGEQVTLTAPAYYEIDGVKYTVSGGTLERPSATAQGWTNETFTGNSYTFVQRGEEGARLTWNIAHGGYRPPSVVTSYAPYAETVSAVADKEPDADGFYPAGTTWTLSVNGLKTTLPQSRLVRWVGDVPEGHEHDEPLILTPTSGQLAVRAEIAHDWLFDAYDGEAGGYMITDGAWKLKATKDGYGHVSIGNGWVAGGGYLEGPSTPTPLDLSTTITDASGNPLSLYWIGNPAFKQVANISALRIVSSTLVTIGAETFYGLPDLGDVYLDIPNCTTINYSCISFNPKLTNLVVHADNLTMCAPGKPWRPFAGNEKLVRAELRLPRLTYLPNYFVYNCPLTDTDFSTWDLSSVQTISEYAFQWSKMTSALALPALREVKSWAFYGANCGSSLVLGSKYLTSIEDNAFVWCSSIQSVTLGNAKNLTIGEKAFLGDRPQQAGSSVCPKTVTFLGAAPTQANIDNILSAVPEKAGDKYCRIYASVRCVRRDGAPNWRDLAAEPTGSDETAAAATEAAAQAAAGRTLLGVYRNGSRKAWLIDQTSPFEPVGVMLFIH